MSKVKIDQTQRVLLLIVTGIVVVLVTLIIFLCNLLVISRPQFIKTQLAKANIYQAMVEPWQQSWINFLSQSISPEQMQQNGITEKIKASMSADWLQGEFERNLDELSGYINKNKQELTLNLNFAPVKQQIAEQFSGETKQELRQEFETTLPDKIDFFGSQALFNQDGAKEIYQLRLTREALSLCLKILFFLIFFALATFFLLVPPPIAWRWTGISLISSGFFLLIITMVIKLVALSRLTLFLAQKLAVIPLVAQAGSHFLTNTLKTYLSLVAWQAILIFLLGWLLVLLVMIQNEKK